jgi:hypothetical protein
MTKSADQENIVSSNSEDFKRTFDKEAEAAKEVLKDAADASKKTISDIGSNAKTAAAKEAESVKREASVGLHAFADAVRSAGAKLGESDQGVAARMVQEAASGLERLSTSLGKKQLQDIIDDVRDFGRKNPTAFIAGSVLVGLALGRFVRSTDDDRIRSATSRDGGDGGSDESRRAL